MSRAGKIGALEHHAMGGATHRPKEQHVTGPRRDSRRTEPIDLPLGKRFEPDLVDSLGFQLRSGRAEQRQGTRKGQHQTAHMGLQIDNGTGKNTLRARSINGKFGGMRGS